MTEFTRSMRRAQDDCLSALRFLPPRDAEEVARVLHLTCIEARKKYEEMME